MTQEIKNKIITRAMHFIETNAKNDSYRIGQAIIEELKLVKKLTITVAGSNEVKLPTKQCVRENDIEKILMENTFGKLLHLSLIQGIVKEINKALKYFIKIKK